MEWNGMEWNGVGWNGMEGIWHRVMWHSVMCNIMHQVAHLIELGSASVRPSRTGAASDSFRSSTRTSKNAWVRRAASPIVDAIFRRAADLLNISEVRRRGWNKHSNLECDVPHHRVV